MTDQVVSAGEAAGSVAAGALELLAPAGDMAALQAALEAGAGAVYFGLTALNARRRARNFSAEEFGTAVAAVHAAGARAYLTLNVDLAERELMRAAQILAWARQCGADAVLIRDPALLALRPEFPELEFHFSTQTCMANSSDVAAARDLGADRVVLARELTLAEITAAAAVSGIRTEVFVQGALCFCVSGRCLLSSWVGGHSGNRGACTSPCRVPWTVDDAPAGTPFSMRDLGTIHRLDELRQAGVAALKIEGRLKNADWVRRAVGLYRRALDGEDGAALVHEATALGAYTGRLLTCGYLDGQRDELTGLAGRGAVPAASAPDEAAVWPADAEGEPAFPVALATGPDAEASCGFQDREEESPADTWETAEDDESPLAPGRGGQGTYELEILTTDKSIACRCTCRDRTESWTMPKTVVRRAHKAVPVGRLLEHLGETPVDGCQLRRAMTDDPDYLLVPRAANALVGHISGVLRRARKVREEPLPVELPPAVLELLEKGEPNPANRRPLDGPPDRARLDADAVDAFIQEVRPDAVIVEGCTAENLRAVHLACRRVPLIVALPPVLFEDEIPQVQELLRGCARAKLVVEVNSWGGWRLAKDAGVRFEIGPGLPVLNSLAARQLSRCGAECVTLSIEADRKQLEALTECCTASCALVVFGRPPLLTTRAQLAPETYGHVYEDRRGVRLVPRREQTLAVFRPQEPFDLRNRRNERIRVRHLVVDLIGSPDPVGEWHGQPGPGATRFRFNYDRSLA